MPQKMPPKCDQCESLESLLWHPTETGQMCHNCFEEQTKINVKSELDSKESNNKMIMSTTMNNNNNNTNTNTNNSSKDSDDKKLRKSTRSTRYKARGAANNNNNQSITGVGNSSNSNTSGLPINAKIVPKGRSRRNIFKKHPTKTPIVTVTTSYVESLFYNGSYVQIGDIVSLSDHNDDVYYAQIRGLLIDTYCEKSAFLTWLIPTKSSPSPNERFDASTYLIGPDEDFPRKLSCMEFVMHAPSNYYHNKNMPYPPPDIDDNTTATNGGFIWTNLVERNTSAV